MDLAELQAELVLVNAALRAKLAGGVVEEWSEATERVRYCTIAELRAWRDDLVEQIRAMGGGTSFSFGVMC